MLFETVAKVDIKEQSPLSLAFVGDGVLELLVRSRLVGTTRLVPNKLHATTVLFVSAKGQFKALKFIEQFLTEKELDVVKRGQNASKATVSKNATAEEYRASTAIEALFGWLYLQQKNDRIEELFELIWQNQTK